MRLENPFKKSCQNTMRSTQAIVQREHYVEKHMRLVKSKAKLYS